jgi:transglutaminase-like putative cysteine protease
MDSGAYLHGVRSAGRYQVVSTEGVITTLIRFWWPFEAPDQAVVEAEAALRRWVGLGLPHRRAGMNLLFDPYQVINFATEAGLRGEDDAFAGKGVPTIRRAVTSLMDVKEGVFDFHFRREFGTWHGPRWRLPFPLGPQAGPVKWSLSLPGAAVTVEPGRAEVRVPPEGTGAVVEYRGRFVAREAPWHDERMDVLGPEEEELYLRRNERLIRVTASVERLAESLTHNAADAWGAVVSFWRFFFNHLKVGYVHADELDPTDPLIDLVRCGWTDCWTGSSLLVGLCRARGIPARVVSGYVLHPALPDEHFWAEVFLPERGWIPLDVGSWYLAAGRPDDPLWSDLHLGWIEPRLVVQRLPRQVVGRPAGPFPAAWYRLVALHDAGTESAYFDPDGVRLLYRDHLSAHRLPSPVARDLP